MNVNLDRLFLTYEKNLTIPKARAIQAGLMCRCIERSCPGPFKWVGGTDVSIKGNYLIGAIVVLEPRSWQVIEVARAKRAVRFPYIPGYLGFRELPVLAEAWSRLSRKPDVLIVDGQGKAHPKEFGIACHLGVELNVPTVGCGKSRLIGEYREPSKKKGSLTRLVYHDRVIGCVLRSRTGVKPIFVSAGHQSDLESAVKIIKRSLTQYRLPEPIRAAHQFSGELFSGAGVGSGVSRSSSSITQ